MCVWVKQDGANSPLPQGERPKFLFLVNHMYPAMKVRESVERCAKPAVRPRKFATQTNTWDLMKVNKYWKVVQWVKSFSETPMTGFHTWHLHGHKESHLMHDMKYSI